jgi:hypothetical protein
MKIPIGDNEVELDEESIRNLLNYVEVMSEIYESQKQSIVVAKAAQPSANQPGKIPA